MSRVLRVWLGVSTILLSCCGQRVRRSNPELVLFSVIGSSPFSDTVATVNLDGSDFRPFLVPRVNVRSYMFASAYRYEGPFLVSVHELTSNGRTSDALKVYSPTNQTWKSVDTPSGSVGRAVFSPDYSKIAFVFAGAQERFYKLYLKNSDTGEVSGPLGAIESEREDYPTWSPTGNELIFVGLRSSSGRLTTRLVRVSIPNRMTVDLLGPDDLGGGAAYSPDGQKICILSKRGIEEIELSTLNRTLILDWKQLPYKAFRFGCIARSPRTNAIVFVILNSSSNKWEVWTVSARGEAPKKLYTATDGTIEGLSVLS